MSVLDARDVLALAFLLVAWDESPDLGLVTVATGLAAAGKVLAAAGKSCWAYSPGQVPCDGLQKVCAHFGREVDHGAQTPAPQLRERWRR